MSLEVLLEKARQVAKRRRIPADKANARVRLLERKLKAKQDKLDKIRSQRLGEHFTELAKTDTAAARVLITILSNADQMELLTFKGWKPEVALLPPQLPRDFRSK